MTTDKDTQAALKKLHGHECSQMPIRLQIAAMIIAASDVKPKAALKEADELIAEHNKYFDQIKNHKTPSYNL